MHRIAIRALTHDRGKLASALAGVAFAATLLLVQIGIYRGFLDISAAVVTRAGGDVWIMARGTRVVDIGEPLSAGSRLAAQAHPCVARVRGLIVAYGFMRQADGTLGQVQIVGVEPAATPPMPWSIERGLPHDLAAPGRVAIDALDLDKLGIRGDPLGAAFEVSGETAHVAVVTRGIRAFSLLPYVFMDIRTARRQLRLADGQATYWVLDLRERACTAAVIRAVERQPDLQARTTAAFVAASQDYWVRGSGAGTALGFSALLGLVVGIVIVAQTLYAITNEHLRELGTLKAIGASNLELAGFVGWQAAFLAVVGGASGVGVAFLVKRGVASAGLTVALSPGVLGFGLVAIAAMCALASASTVRRVVRLEAAEVFK